MVHRAAIGADDDEEGERHVSWPAQRLLYPTSAQTVSVRLSAEKAVSPLLVRSLDGRKPRTCRSIVGFVEGVRL